MIVTIDGPAGTGKSTVARLLADRLGFEFLNTGAMYRAVAFACLQRDLKLEDERAVGEIVNRLEIKFSQNRLILSGQDVTEAIRGQEVTQSASIVAAIPTVRKRLVELQRLFGQGTSLVTGGKGSGNGGLSRCGMQILPHGIARRTSSPASARTASQRR